MKTNKILLIVIAILIIVGLSFVSTKNNEGGDKIEQASSSSSLVSDKEIYDFGEIDIFAGKVETEFALTNNGSDDITILDGTTSCGCTEGEIGGIKFGMHEKMNSEFTILAGETKNLKVVYDPLAHGPNGTGKINRQVFLKTNSTVTPEIGVRITADVIKSEE